MYEMVGRAVQRERARTYREINEQMLPGLRF